MNPDRFDAAVEDLRRRLPRPATRAAVVFGSVARGEATEDSDLDLLVIPRSARDEEAILAAIREVEGEHDVPIAAILADLSLSDLERQFLDSVLREGMPIVGAMPRVDVRELQLEPVRLVNFDLRELPVPRKVRLERELFGYTTRKRYRGKEYVRSVPGRLAEWGGRKIGRGTVLVPERAASSLDRLLRAHGAKRIMIPMWIQKA